MDGNRREVFRFHQRHDEGVAGTGRVAEQVDPLLVDVELRRQHLDEVVKEIRTILGYPPALGRKRVGRGQHDAFFLRQRRPRIDKRFAVAPGSVEEDDERRRFGLLRRFGNKQVIRPVPAAGAECFLRRLVCRRGRERQQQRETARQQPRHAPQYTLNRQTQTAADD